MEWGREEIKALNEEIVNDVPTKSTLEADLEESCMDSIISSY